MPGKAALLEARRHRHHLRFLVSGPDLRASPSSMLQLWLWPRLPIPPLTTFTRFPRAKDVSLLQAT
ncbi:hypothetical protein FOFC_20923 [Fusarium oxysporum]|nr:hypothetical protein FOFC_20923 [Fusarium oxysporum]